MEGVDPYPFIWATKIQAPTSLIKLAYLPSAAVNGAVGLPTPVLIVSPYPGILINTGVGNPTASRTPRL